MIEWVMSQQSMVVSVEEPGSYIAIMGVSNFSCNNTDKMDL